MPETKEKPLTKAQQTKLSEKMQMSFLRDIVHVVAGGHAIKIVDILYKKTNVNEFVIAKKLALTINQARNILYRLSDEGMVHFTRKKDTKNGGWYTYFWTLDIEKSLKRLREKLGTHLRELQDELAKRKTTRYYYSPSADIEYSEEKALEHDFICPETGEVMELKDTSDRVAQLEQALGDLALKIAAIDDELMVIFDKEEAAKNRRLKAEAKQKAVEKEEKKKAAAKKRKATLKRKAAEKAKTDPKKVVKKKAVKKKVAKKKVAKKKATRRKAVHHKAVKSASSRTKKVKKQVVRKKVRKATQKRTVARKRK